jgi:hypothetical protein
MKLYQEQFPVGATVRVAERAELERFRREWQFHHKLEAEQLSYAGQTARVRLAFIMEVMCSITSRVFPVSGMRSVFTLWDNPIPHDLSRHSV